MKKRIFITLLMAVIAITGFVCKADSISDTVDGRIGSYPATISYTMDLSKKTVKGYFIFKGSNAPAKGKVTLTGTFKHTSDPDMANYPLYPAKLTAKTSDGKVLGNWNIEIDTRMGTVSGKCTISGKTYKVEFDALDY